MELKRLDNKEAEDALHMLLHCAIKDKQYETQREQFYLVYKYIQELEKLKSKKYIMTLDCDKEWTICEHYKRDYLFSQGAVPKYYIQEVINGLERDIENITKKIRSRRYLDDYSRNRWKAYRLKTKEIKKRLEKLLEVNVKCQIWTKK